MSAVRRLRKGKCQRKVSFYSESGVTDLTEFVASCYDGAAIKALIVQVRCIILISAII